jgi:hypothetical protein
LTCFIFMLCRPVLPYRWRWLEEIKHWIISSQKPFPPKSPHSKQASSQFVTKALLAVCSNQCPETRWCQLQLLSHVRNRHGLLLRLRPRFFSFFESGLLPNFNKIVDRELLIIEPSNWESSPASYWRILALGLVYWVWNKRRKSRWHMSKDDCN